MALVRRRALQDEFLLCKICHYVLQEPRSLACEHTFCLKCIEFCINTSDSPTGWHCPVCSRFYETSKTEGRETWMNRLEKNLTLEQLLSSVHILEHEIVLQSSTNDTQTPTTTSHITHLLQIWKSVTHISTFLIKEEQKKIDLLNKQRKTAQIAIRKMCIDVWNLKRDASAIEWNNLTSRQQTLIAEVDSICSTQSRIIEERIAQETELIETAGENTQHLSSKTDTEIVCDYHQLKNDYSQLMDSGTSLLLYTTAPCVKLVFVPDTVPINRTALGHLLVIDEDNLDHCHEVSEQFTQRLGSKLRERLSFNSSSTEISAESQNTNIEQVTEEYDNKMNDKHLYSSSDPEITVQSQTNKDEEVHEEQHSKTKDKQSGSSSDVEINLGPQNTKNEQTNEEHASKVKEKTTCHSSDSELSIEPQTTSVVKFTRYEDKVDKTHSFSSTDTEINPVKTPDGTHTPDEGYRTDTSVQSSDSVSTRLPLLTLKPVNEALAVTPIASYSSSTTLWWNIDESSATKVHIDLADPNPGDLELFTVSNSSVVVLIDPHNKCIKSFPDSDTCHRLELNYSPVRIAKINEGKCAVTCRLTTLICILDVTPALEITRCIQTRRPYSSISYIPVGSEFVCCEAKKSRSLDILNMNGQVVRAITLPTIDDVRCEPYNVTVMLSDNILICDVIARALVCMSQSGDVLFTYKPEGILLPVGVCSDGQGNIFLADVKEHRVILLTEQGHMVGHVISQKDGLIEPWAIRYDEDRKRFCVIMKRSEFKWFDQTVLDFEQFEQEK